MEENKELQTYGFDLPQIIEDAKANGYDDLAEVLEEQLNNPELGNLQACYDVLAQKYTSAPDTPVYNIDVEYLKANFK